MTKNNALKRIITISLSCILLISGCGSKTTDSSASPSESAIDRFIDRIFPHNTYDKAPHDSYFEMHDNADLYSESFAPPVMYLTVGREKMIGENEHTWNEINAHDLLWYEENGIEPYYCDALVQFGDEEGALKGSFGYENMSSNATVRLSGMKASQRQQKSYRIKINTGSGNVEGTKTLLLSKSFTDPFRFTNKLCFDLYTEIDAVMSTRTRFIHLYVKDETDDEEPLFVDYGLYTMVETVNKKYLSNRDLDSSGELYKVNDFDFGRHSDVIMQPTDPAFDEKKFDELLEAKGSNDYSSLIRMLDAVNDESLPIENIIDTYFDKDNLYSWMAFNIIMDNKDTCTENFYLYSPTGSDTFYIIPWDNEGALRSDYELLRDETYEQGWQKGVYIYTGSRLFDRMLKSQHCINDLSERVAKLHEDVLSADNVSKRASRLAKEVKRRLYDLPDRAFARVTEANYDLLVSMIPTQIDNNFYAYYDSLETPWPFHILEPENRSGQIFIKWDESFLLEGDVSYSVDVSSSWDFENNLASGKNIKGTEFNAGELKPGQYFVRVRANRPGGLYQEAYEFYNTEKKSMVHGVLCFYVLQDGSVVASTFEEG